MKKVFNAWTVFLLLLIAIYTYHFAGKTGWHSKGLWLGAVICVGLVCRGFFQYRRTRLCRGNRLVAGNGRAVYPTLDSGRRADVYAILRNRPVCDCDAETSSKEFELLIFSGSLP